MDPGGLAELVARAFTVYFHLTNLAEEQQRVRSLREVFDTQRVFEPGLLKPHVPPQRSAAGRRADRLGNGAIQIEDDGLDGLTQRRVWIFLLQPPTADQKARERAVVRLGKILEAGAEESDTRILFPRLKSRLW